MSFRRFIQSIGDRVAARLGAYRGPPEPAEPAWTTPCGAATPRFERAAPPFIPEPVDLSLELPALLKSAVPLTIARGCRLEHAVVPGLVLHTDPRVLREAMADILAHAVRLGGARMLVAAHRIAGEAVIKVCVDDATPEAARQEYRLRDAAQVLALQGGTLKVDVRPRQGTVIVIRMPDVAAFPVTMPSSREIAPGARGDAAVCGPAGMRPDGQPAAPRHGSGDPSPPCGP